MNSNISIKNKKPSSISAKTRVLVSGSLPPPMGGVGAYYQTLLGSSLPKQVDLHFVQTSSQTRELSSTGKATFSNLIAAVQDCWRFTRAVLEHRPQITHIGTAIRLSFVKHTFCVFVARLLRSRVILHPHCSLSVLYAGRSKLWQWYFRQVIRLVNGVVVLSKEWQQLSYIVPGSQIFYLPNAINLDNYRRIAEIHLSKVNRKESIKVLYLGSLGKPKGSFDLVDAAATVLSQGLSLVLYMVGSPLASLEFAQLREKIKRLNLDEHVILYPLTYGEEKLNLYNEADIFVYPSYYEGMPMAVLEAMACGLPIIATNVGGLPDLVSNCINGILVEPGKPEQLASALSLLAQNPEMRATMGKASYEIACDNYDIEQHVSHLVKIYSMVLSE